MDGGGASDQAADHLAAILDEAERLFAAGDPGAAIAALEDGLQQARAALAYGPQGLLYAALGDLHRRREDPEAALAQYEQAAAALHEAGDTASEAGALLRCGDAQRALKRVGAASKRYSAAAALYVLIGDARGAGHAEFLLAELAAGIKRDIAEKHYRQAIEFYGEAAERDGAASPEELEDPPDPVTDPRAVSSRQMAVAAERALDRLPVAPAREPEPEPGEWQPPPAPPPAAVAPPAAEAAADGEAPAAEEPPPDAAAPSVLLWFAALGLGTVGVLLVAMPWGETALIGGLVALALGAGLVLIDLRRTGAVSPLLGYGATGLAWLLLVASGARSFVSPAAAPPPAAVPTVARAVAPSAAPEPWTPAGQRATFERKLTEAAAGTPRAQADLLSRWGAFEHAQGERRRSLELWGESVERYRAAEAPGAAAEVAMWMGDLHLRSGRPEPARARFAAAAALYGEARDQRNVARAMRRQGNAEAAMQRWAEAAAAYTLALRIARGQRDTAEEILLVVDIAAIEHALGRAESARALLYRALRLSEGGSPLHARVWLALADFEGDLKVDAAAQRAYDRAVSLAGAERDAALEARGMRHWARYERRRGLLGAARNRYEVAMRLAYSREARVAEALSRLQAAELEVQLGDRLAARAGYADAARLFAGAPHSRGAARVALGLGDLYARFGDTGGAEAEYARAVELAAQADHSGLEIAALERLARLLAERAPQQVADYAARAATLRATAFGAAAAGDEAASDDAVPDGAVPEAAPPADAEGAAPPRRG